MNSMFKASSLTLAVSLALTSANTTAETVAKTNVTQDVEKISVLGSRVSTRTATESTAPVDLIDASSLTKGGFTELGQSLQATAPSFNFSRTQISDGSDLFRPATLRGLQPDQTLVLVNGKRRHNQAIFGLSGTVGAGAAGTDMNAIPLTALANVQVLRDGAAAQYGSDAIAGVINLSLKSTTGITTGFIQSGATDKGDGKDTTVGLNRGFDLGEEGGFINLSLESRQYEGTNRAQADTGGSSTIAKGTLSDTVRWKQGNAQSDFMTVFYNLMFPVGDIELYSFGGMSNRTALGNGFYRDFDAAAKNVPQVYPDGFLPVIDNEAQDLSFAVGLRGDLNSDWSYDLSAVYGANKYDFSSDNTINASYAAEYLANNPAASDADIAKNSGPTSGYSGGFRFEQFTINADISGSVDIGSDIELFIAYGGEYRQENYQIIEGDIASYACGASNSQSSSPSVIDPNTFAHCGFQAYPGLRPDAAIKADRYSLAAYVDLETQITDQWLVGAALRYEDFSQAGDDIIGKLSSRYDITDGFSVRGALSTGFRAPSLQQSGYTAYTNNLGPDGVLSPAFTASAGADLPVALGIEGLTLESSKNISLGFVLDVTDSITMTFDAYRIAMQDRITLGSLLSPNDVSFSPEAVAAFDAAGVLQANYFSNSVDLTTTGLDLIMTYKAEFGAGDLELTFAGNLNETKIDQVNTPAGIPKVVALDDLQRSFLIDGQPGERATLSANYAENDWQLIVKANYFGETDVTYFGNDHIGLPGFLSPTGEFEPTSIVESAVLVDLNVDYTISDNFTLSVGVNNVFDVTPDELGADEALDFITNQAFKYPVRALPYGFDGKSYYARLAFSF